MKHEVSKGVEYACLKYSNSKNFEDFKRDILEIIEKHKHKVGELIYQNVGLAMITYSELSTEELREHINKIQPKIWSALLNWYDSFFKVE